MSEEKTLKEQIVVPSKDLQSYIEQFETKKKLLAVKVVNPDVALLLSSRSGWGAHGGLGYLSQVYAYWHGQTTMKEWKCTDTSNPNYDHRYLGVRAFGNAKIEEEKERGKIILKVALLNPDYDGDRWDEFIFWDFANAQAPLVIQE